MLGTIAALTGFNILRFIVYIKDELLTVLGTSSSESALVPLMQKLAEAADAEMTRLEKEMATSAGEARSALDTLRRVQPSAKSPIDESMSALKVRWPSAASSAHGNRAPPPASSSVIPSLHDRM